MPGTRGAVDPRRREQYVGLGCALENLVFGCHARGLQTAVRVPPDGPAAPRVAEVVLTRAHTWSILRCRQLSTAPSAAADQPSCGTHAVADSSTDGVVHMRCPCRAETQKPAAGAHCATAFSATACSGSSLPIATTTDREAPTGDPVDDVIERLSPRWSGRRSGVAVHLDAASRCPRFAGRSGTPAQYRHRHSVGFGRFAHRGASLFAGSFLQTAPST
jgi:hypothetical protein